MSSFKKRSVIIKVIIVLITLAIVGLFPTERVFGCTCTEPGTTEEKLKESDAVFMGRVTSISAHPADPFSKVVRRFHPDVEIGDVKVGILVGQSWKGVPTDFIYVYTHFGRGSCGYQLTMGETYLFYAYGPVNDLHISICSGTARYNEAQEDRNYLNQLQELPLTHFGPQDYSVNTKKDRVIILLAGSTIAFLTIAVYLFVKNQQIKRKID